MGTPFKLTFDQSIIIAFVVALILVGYLGYLSIEGVNRLEETGRQVEHTHAVIEHLQLLRSDIEQAASGVRGYVITRKGSNYQAVFDAGRQALPLEFTNLTQLVAANPARTHDLDVLKELVGDYLTKLQSLLTPAAGQPPDSLTNDFEASNDLLWQIDSYIKAMQTDEERLLEQHATASVQNSKMERLTVLVGTLSAAWIIVVSIIFLQWEMRSRRELQAELALDAELLKAANKELEAFSYSVSHDLRAPLRHIHGFVELLQKAPSIQAEESTRRKLDVISKAARQMGLLIDDLLAFSRTSRSEMHCSEVLMGDLVQAAIEEIKPTAEGRKIDWVVGPLPSVDGDPRLLSFVWLNLLGNAVKYTRPREVARIEITATKEAHEVIFCVRDNGVGFDARFKDKLFGVFQRLHREEDFEGTGIGLANVRQIVQRHGGRVWAEGEIDAGAAFFFALPSDSSVARNAFPGP